MRITCDLDSKNRLKLKWACLKGRILCHKAADRIYATRRGYHLVFDDVRDKSGTPITEERMFEIRKKLGDDMNRIKLDMQGNRLKQVLFNEKIVRWLNDGYLEKEESFVRKRIK